MLGAVPRSTTTSFKCSVHDNDYSLSSFERSEIEDKSFINGNMFMKYVSLHDVYLTNHNMYHNM